MKNTNITVQVLLAFLILSTLGHIFVAAYNPTLPIYWVLAGGYGCAICGMLLAVTVLNFICMLCAAIGGFFIHALDSYEKEDEDEQSEAK